MKAKAMGSVMKGTVSEFFEDKALRLSAALAYYAMFSLGPLLVIAVGLAGLAFDRQTVTHTFEQQLSGMVGQDSAKTLESMMAAQKHGTSVITVIVGTVILLFGASGLFGQLQDALNTIWDVKAKPGQGIWSFIRQRFLSLTMVLGVGFLLLVSLMLSTFMTAFSGWLGGLLPIPEAAAHALNFVVSFAVVTLLFAMIFKALPDVKIPLSKVWVGAIATSLLFVLGKYLLALYLGRSSTTSSFGAAGSVIVIMMWVYYASVILLFGAEFTQVYARATGTKVVPNKYAVPVTENERAVEGMPEEESKTGQRKPTVDNDEDEAESRLPGHAWLADEAKTRRGLHRGSITRHEHNK
jgi:membrane protein